MGSDSAWHGQDGVIYIERCVHPFNSHASEPYWQVYLTGHALYAVITPGRLKDRKSFMAGPFKSRRLTRAAFSTLLGPFSFDSQAKAQAGQAAVYVINGFKCALSFTCSALSSCLDACISLSLHFRHQLCSYCCLHTMQVNDASLWILQNRAQALCLAEVINPVI